jgi:hypothetical protein
MTLTIESDVQIPKRRHGRINTLPFDQLEPGQSFFVPLSVKRPGTVQVATTRANQIGDGKEFKCSTVQTKPVTVEGREPTIVKGARVWRVK